MSAAVIDSISTLDKKLSKIESKLGLQESTPEVDKYLKTLKEKKELEDKIRVLRIQQVIKAYEENTTWLKYSTTEQLINLTDVLFMKYRRLIKENLNEALIQTSRLQNVLTSEEFLSNEEIYMNIKNRS